MEYISNLDVSPYLYHHGILGMKWGIRRYQNADGTLTAAGKKRYNQLESQAKKYDAEAAEDDRKAAHAKTALSDMNKNGRKSKYYEEFENPDYDSTLKSAKSSAKFDKEYYTDVAKYDRAIVKNIRETKCGEKSLVEITNRKNTISKGATAIVGIGGVALTVALRKKGLIDKGTAACAIILSGAAAIRTRFNTAGNIYDELRKRDPSVKSD